MNNYKLSKKSVAVKELFPQPLTDRQVWILGLGGVLSAYMRENFECLHPNKMVNDVTAGMHQESLKRDWAITDFPSLLEQLSSLLLHGLRPELADQVGHPPLAWDYGRYVNVVRWAFAAEFMDEQTGWMLLEAVVVPVLSTYSSWSSFARDFLIGRDAWNQGGDKGRENAAMGLWMPSQADKSPWQRISWPSPRPMQSPGGVV